MTATIKVEFDALDAVVSRLSNSHDGIRDVLDTLGERVTTLRSQWTGEAAAAYDAAHAQWMASVRELDAVLEAAVSELAAANERYRSAERRNSARWPG